MLQCARLTLGCTCNYFFNTVHLLTVNIIIWINHFFSYCNFTVTNGLVSLIGLRRTQVPCEERDSFYRL